MDDTIRTLIGRKLRDGRLPLNGVSRVWGVPSAGDVCFDVCDRTITKQQFVLAGIASLSDKKRNPIHFHIRCFELWTNEKHQLQERTARVPESPPVCR